MATDRGQTEAFQHILMAAILVGVVSIGAVTVLGDVDNQIRNTPPTADFDVTVDSNNVTVIHEGGDPFARSELLVVVQYRSGGTVRFRLSDANTTFIGDPDSTFQTGEKAVYPHGFSDGNARISIFHVPTNRRLFETTEIIPVNPKPTATFSVSCTKTDCSFDASASTDAAGTIQSYSWDFGDTTTSQTTSPTTSHTYSSGGTYTITLTVTDDDGKTGQTQRTITIYDTTPPTADFSYSPSSPTSVDTVSFTDQSTDSDGSIASYQWSFGDGNTSTAQNPTNSYPDDGTYEVTLTVTDDVGASDTVTKTITVVNAVPTADFNVSPVSPQPDQTVTFTDESADPDGIISSWEWDLGDGTTSLQQNVTHTYSSTGTYTVSLTVMDNDDATATKTDTLTVSIDATPAADFSYTPSSPQTGETVSFTDESTDNGTIMSWQWDFGDGATSTNQNPTHAYSDDGTYTVSLTVTDNNGNTDTVTRTVTVSNRAPSASFTYSPATPSTLDTIQFDGSASSDSDDSIASYEWDLGSGGSTKTGVTTSKRYTSPGTYTVTLTVTDDDGTTNSTSQTITVQQEPAFASAPTITDTTDDTQGGASYEVDYTVDDPDTRLKNVTVIFENVDSPSETVTNSSTATSGSITYGPRGGNTKGDNYRITVEVYNINGVRTDSYQVSDTAGGGDPGQNLDPTADFTYSPTSPKTDETITFDGSSSTDPENSISSYEWDLDNDGIYEQSGTTITHSYPDNGDYLVTLKITDNGGNEDTQAYTVSVSNRLPTVDTGGSYTVNENETVGLDGTGSSDPDGSITGYSWTITNDPTGGATLSNQNTATPTFNAPTDVAENQEVTVQLTVTDDDGDSSTTTTTVTVVDTDAANSAPVASFTYSPSQPAPGTSVNFDASGSNDVDGSITTYEWDWDGDGTYEASTASATTSHTFTSSGDYSVTLRVTDDNGATTTKTKTVVVNAAPTASFSTSCTGLECTFTSDSSDSDGTIDTYAWDFDGDGTVESTTSSNSATHTYSQPGTYSVTLTVTDDDGKSDSVTQTITVKETTPPTIDSFSATANQGSNQNRAGSVTFDYQVSDNFGIDRVEFTVTETQGSSVVGSTTKTSTSGTFTLDLSSDVNMNNPNSNLDINITAIDTSGNRRICTGTINDVGQTITKSALTCSSQTVASIQPLDPNWFLEFDDRTTGQRLSDQHLSSL